MVINHIYPKSLAKEGWMSDGKYLIRDSDNYKKWQEDSYKKVGKRIFWEPDIYTTEEDNEINLSMEHHVNNFREYEHKKGNKFVGVLPSGAKTELAESLCLFPELLKRKYLDIKTGEKDALRLVRNKDMALKAITSEKSSDRMFWGLYNTIEELCLPAPHGIICVESNKLNDNALCLVVPLSPSFFLFGYKIGCNPYSDREDILEPLVKGLEKDIISSGYSAFLNTSTQFTPKCVILPPKEW